MNPGFHPLGLTRRLCDTVRKAGYDDPTPIQREAIPYVLDGRDVLGCAQTGTGKTAAFALPILDQLLAEPPTKGRSGIRVLVLAPTRELAAQIGESFGRYGAGTGLHHLVVFGGVKREPQVRALRRDPAILVATPGRLLDLMGTRDVKLGAARHVVLDEADRMLDMGFIHDVRKIMEAVPEKRQTLLFSATMPPEIERLARKILTRPERVAVDPVSSTCAPISQSVYFVEKPEKLSLLVRLLESDEVERTLVFTRTKHGANKVARGLEKARIGADAIHGNKSQSARERALHGFKTGKTRVIVATDLASRGLDVKGISHVINYDLPNEPESYVHRVGRTGRAGASGNAFSFCSADERPYLRSIERLTGRRLATVEHDRVASNARTSHGANDASGSADRKTQPRAPKARTRPKRRSRERMRSRGSERRST